MTTKSLVRESTSSKILQQLITLYIYSGAMELLKVMMLVGGFVYVTMALSIEGAKKGIIYSVAKIQCKSIILVVAYD